MCRKHQQNLGSWFAWCNRSCAEKFFGHHWWKICWWHCYPAHEAPWWTTPGGHLASVLCLFRLLLLWSWQSLHCQNFHSGKLEGFFGVTFSCLLKRHEQWVVSDRHPHHSSTHWRWLWQYRHSRCFEEIQMGLHGERMKKWQEYIEITKMMNIGLCHHFNSTLKEWFYVQRRAFSMCILVFIGSILVGSCIELTGIGKPLTLREVFRSPHVADVPPVLRHSQRRVPFWSHFKTGNVKRSESW